MNRSTMFSIVRIYCDSNGDSRFEDTSLPLEDEGKIGNLSQALPVKSIIFREVEDDYEYDFHNAPQKQYLVMLNGAIEIENSLGEKRQFHAGDILLLEDTEGKGHRTKNIEPGIRRSVFITL